MLQHVLYFIVYIDSYVCCNMYCTLLFILIRMYVVTCIVLYFSQRVEVHSLSDNYNVSNLTVSDTKILYSCLLPQRPRCCLKV